jgi:hypothetical protein
MAVTQSTLLLLGALGTLAGMGMLRNLGDPVTRFVVAVISVVVWALFAFSATDVIVRETYAASASAPIAPLVWLGVAFAFLSVIVLLDRLADLIQARTGARETRGVGEP